MIQDILLEATDKMEKAVEAAKDDFGTIRTGRANPAMFQKITVDYTPQLLYQVAKMDGAIVTNAEVSRILRAAVQLVPDSRIETSESGTRHRTAERVAKQTGYPVVSVSQSMRPLLPSTPRLPTVPEPMMLPAR